MSPAISQVLRKITPLLTIALVVVAILVTAYNYIFQPKIVVTAPTESLVTVSNISSGILIIRQKTTSPSTTFRVTPGNYKIIISHNTNQELAYDTATTFSTHTVTFTAPQELHSSAYAQQVAYNVIRNANAISFIDTTKRIIGNIGITGSATALDSASPVNNFSDTNPGMAQSMHVIAGNQAIVLSGGNLYVLRNNGLQPIDTTGMPTSISTAEIGTNPDQDSFVICVNNRLYWYNSPDGTPVKVADLNKQVDQLAYGGSYVLAYSTRMPTSLQDIRSSYSTYAVDPILINTTDKSQRTFVSGPIADASISPDGHLTTIEPEGVNETSIYNTSSVTRINEVENPDVTTPYWINNTHYIYAKGSIIWDYDASSNSAFALADLGNKAPTSITAETSTGDYFVTTYQDANDAVIYLLTP